MFYVAADFGWAQVCAHICDPALETAKRRPLAGSVRSRKRGAVGRPLLGARLFSIQIQLRIQSEFLSVSFHGPIGRSLLGARLRTGARRVGFGQATGARALIRRFAASASLCWPVEAIERGRSAPARQTGMRTFACRRRAAVRHGQGLASTDESGNLDYGVVAFVCRQHTPARLSASLAALLRANACAPPRASTRARAHTHTYECKSGPQPSMARAPSSAPPSAPYVPWLLPVCQRLPDQHGRRT